jgi:hypothetical protein
MSDDAGYFMDEAFVVYRNSVAAGQCGTDRGIEAEVQWNQPLEK